ncbi:hypothetical protein KIPB_002766, partial [Kipferlia bialata]
GFVAALLCTIRMFKGVYHGKFYESFLSERWTATLTLAASVVSMVAASPISEDIGSYTILGVTLRELLVNTASTTVHLVINVIFTSRAYHFIFHLCSLDTRQKHKGLYVLAFFYCAMTICDMVGKLTVEYYATQFEGFFGTFVNSMRACIILNRLFQICGEIFFFCTIVFSDFLLTGSFSHKAKSASLSVSSVGEGLMDGATPVRDMNQGATSAGAGVVLSMARNSSSSEVRMEREREREREASGLEVWDRESELILGEEELQTLMHQRRRFNAVYSLYWVILAVVFLGRCLYVQYVFNQLSEDPTFAEYRNMCCTILTANAVMVIILSGMNPIAVSRGVPDTLQGLFSLDHGYTLFQEFLERKGSNSVASPHGCLPVLGVESVLFGYNLKQSENMLTCASMRQVQNQCGNTYAFLPRAEIPHMHPVPKVYMFVETVSGATGVRGDDIDVPAQTETEREGERGRVPLSIAIPPTEAKTDVETVSRPVSVEPCTSVEGLHFAASTPVSPLASPLASPASMPKSPVAFRERRTKRLGTAVADAFTETGGHHPLPHPILPLSAGVPVPSLDGDQGTTTTTTMPLDEVIAMAGPRLARLSRGMCRRERLGQVLPSALEGKADPLSPLRLVEFSSIPGGMAWNRSQGVSEDTPEREREGEGERDTSGVSFKYILPHKLHTLKLLVSTLSQTGTTALSAADCSKTLSDSFTRTPHPCLPLSTLVDALAPHDMYRFDHRLERLALAWAASHTPAGTAQLQRTIDDSGTLYIAVVATGRPTGWDIVFPRPVRQFPDGSLCFSDLTSPCYTYVDGDGTVPRSSADADGLRRYKELYVESGHQGVLQNETFMSFVTDTLSEIGSQ